MSSANRASHTFPPWEDVAQCQEVLLNWAESYDRKDWALLRSIVAPTLYLDYRQVMGEGKGEVWPEVPKEKFVGMVSSDKFLGNAKLRTQHLVGAVRWVRVTGDHLISHQQMRVAHQMYTSPDLKEVDFKGHGHGKCQIHYKRVDGTWKFGGLEPEQWWTEYNYEKFFNEHLD